MTSRIGFLFRNKASFTRAAKHTLVKLTILPTLDFSNVIYKIASNTLLIKLDVVYHSAIRFVMTAPLSLVIPKASTSLAAFPSSYLLPMTGTNCKNHWSWRLISLSNFKHQLSEQLTNHCTCTQPICKYHTQLPHPHIIIYRLALLHPGISTCTSSSAYLSLQC